MKRISPIWKITLHQHDRAEGSKSRQREVDVIKTPQSCFLINHFNMCKSLQENISNMIVFKLILADMGSLEWREVEITNKFSPNISKGIPASCQCRSDFKMRFVHIFMQRNQRNILQYKSSNFTERDQFLYSHMDEKV